MARITALRALFVAVGALSELIVWVVTIPDAFAASGRAVVTWLVLEAVVAVLIGVVAAEWELVVAAVLAGWVLQAVQYALGVTKDDAHNLWAVLVFLQVLLAAGAVGLALLARVLTRRVRRRPGG